MEQEATTQTKQEKRTVRTGVTRAAKAKRQKDILKNLLKTRSYKWNELLEEAVKVYVEKYNDDAIDIPDLKGKFGSNFSLLEAAGEVSFDKATNLCSSALKPSRKTSRTEKAAATNESATSEGKEKEKESAAVTSRRVKSKRIAAEQAEEKNAEKPEEKISEAISAEEEKRSAIESALKIAVEKAAAKKSEKNKEPVRKAETISAQNTAAAEKVAENNAEKTAKKRGGKSVKKADANVESAKVNETAAGGAESTAEPTAPSQNTVRAAGKQKIEQTPAQNDVFTLISSKEHVAESGDGKEEKTTVRAEKKTAKNELLLTEFAFLGNAAKRSEIKQAQDIAAPVMPVTSAAPVTLKTEATAANEQMPEEKKNDVGIGENNAEEKKNEAPMGGTNAQNAAEKPAARLQSGESVQAKTARNTQSRTAQSTQTAHGRTARQNGTNARENRANGVYAIVQNPDDKLKEEFLRRLRSMSGEYFEYYSVYLLERYSLKNGRRLESLRISGGKNDGGIDGEIELTDRFGFRETIYIQAKNWDPTKGVAEKWMIGETLIQQFVGAATCRQSKDGKRNCRGIFMTTSSFTKEAKDILSVLGEKFVGYDGDEVFETAKECSFGLIRVNGVWQLDEKLLSGDKAFFNM